VVIEIVAGFLLPRISEVAQMFGLAVGKSVGLRSLVAPTTLGLLAGCSEIHKISHFAPRSNGMCFARAELDPRCIPLMTPVRWWQAATIIFGEGLCNDVPPRLR